MKYTPPARFIDFDRSVKGDELKDAWHKRVKRRVDEFKSLPRFLDPLQVDATAARDAVSWSGFPRALDAWLDVENKPLEMARAHAAAEVLDRAVFGVLDGQLMQLPFIPSAGLFFAPERNGNVSVDDAFSISERPQDEYLEWFVVRDPATGRVLRIDYTVEAPEYWETLAEGDPSLAATIYSELLNETVEEGDLILPGDVFCPELEIQPDGTPFVARHIPILPFLRGNGDGFRKGDYNPWNIWNTERGAVHLIQRNNTLFAEITLAAEATQRFAVRPDLDTDVDRFTLTTCGGFGGVNRNSDPSIGYAVNTLALDNLRVMVSDPIGLYIGSVDLTSFRDPTNNPVNRDDILSVQRGSFSDEDGLARVLRFSVHPPKNADYTLDQCSFDGFPLDTGGPIARKTSVIIHGIGMPEANENPIVSCGNELCEHPTRRPKLFLPIAIGRTCPAPESPEWRKGLPIPVPDASPGMLTNLAARSLRGAGRRS